MDPPQEGDEAHGVVHGMAARLGLGEGATRAGGLELMEQLGLGEGTRVVDLQVSKFSVALGPVRGFERAGKGSREV